MTKNDALISTIKPDGHDYKEPPVVDISKIWTSLEMTKKTFKEKGFNLDAVNDSLTSSHPIGADYSTENFFSKADISKQEISQTITVMHRQKAVDYSQDKNGVQKRQIKEFLTYGVHLEGVDWLGNPIQTWLEYEGRCDEPTSKTSISVDKNGKQTAQKEFNGTRFRYYIPFSKKAVDDILERTGTDKKTIKYYGKFGDPDSLYRSERNSDFTYEQFVSTEWDDFEELYSREGGPRGKVKMIHDDK